jgi:hypothetical protein
LTILEEVWLPKNPEKSPVKPVFNMAARVGLETDESLSGPRDEGGDRPEQSEVSEAEPDWNTLSAVEIYDILFKVCHIDRHVTLKVKKWHKGPNMNRAITQLIALGEGKGGLPRSTHKKMAPSKKIAEVRLSHSFTRLIFSGPKTALCEAWR